MSKLTIAEVTTVAKFKTWCAQQGYDAVYVLGAWYAQSASGAQPYMFTNVDGIELTTPRYY